MRGTWRATDVDPLTRTVTVSWQLGEKREGDDMTMAVTFNPEYNTAKVVAGLMPHTMVYRGDETEGPKPAE